MLSILGPQARLCDGITRREMLRIGGLGFAGLTLADVLRLQAQAGTSAGRGRSVIMIWLRGGASHIDSYDMKPDAPPEVRGEFNPISTAVPGIEICEYLPLHAQMMDKLAIVRGIKSNDLGDHTPHYILTGHPTRGIRPTLGAVVSYLRPRTDGIPPYVSTYSTESFSESTYTGPAHKPFIPNDRGLSNLSLAREISIQRLSDRQQLLGQFDAYRRQSDAAAAAFEAHDTFTSRALQTITSPAVRNAFDLKQEAPETYARYGKYCESLLLARRVVEAGVSVVTLKIGD